VSINEHRADPGTLCLCDSVCIDKRGVRIRRRPTILDTVCRGNTLTSHCCTSITNLETAAAGRKTGTDRVSRDVKFIYMPRCLVRASAFENAYLSEFADASHQRPTSNAHHSLSAPATFQPCSPASMQQDRLSVLIIGGGVGYASIGPSKLGLNITPHRYCRAGRGSCPPGVRGRANTRVGAYAEGSRSGRHPSRRGDSLPAIVGH
jgi:hypothetical protein